jgi:hypothetical protein
MPNWDWLIKPEKPYTWGFALRVVIKALVLFAVFNLAFALLKPVPALGKLSLYNGVVPGRARLPYGENPAASYNLSLMTLDAMFASHEVAAAKDGGEFRVLLIGDSATWGWLLEPEDTLAGQINAGGYTLEDGRRVRVYNLGYPIMSLAKDVMLLDYAMRYEPDMVVWPVTLESFPRGKQLFPPLVQHNPEPVRRLIDTYSLDLDANDPRFVEPDLLEQTIVGQRRALADLLRLQLYGVMWGAAGIDQEYRDYEKTPNDLEDSQNYESFEGPPFPDGALAFDVLGAGVERAGDVPVLLVNEPVFLADGENSDVRYNALYPRWAYDSYRGRLIEAAGANGWHLLDAWDLVDPAEFTDSAVHLTPAGTSQFAEAVAAEIAAVAGGE